MRPLGRYAHVLVPEVDLVIRTVRVAAVDEECAGGSPRRGQWAEAHNTPTTTGIYQYTAVHRSPKLRVLHLVTAHTALRGGGVVVTNGQDEPQAYSGQWQPQVYDPAAYSRRMEARPRDASWQQVPYPEQDYGSQYPPPDQPWQAPGTLPQSGHGEQHSYLPPQPARRKSWTARHKVLTSLISVAGLIVVADVAGAVGSPGTKKPVASTAAVAAPASSVAAASISAAAPDCSTQAKTWVNGSNLTTFGSDIGAFGSALQTLAGDLTGDAAPAGDMAAIQSAAATIQSDAQALEADPGPPCVPDMRADLNAVARDYSTAAIDATNALNQLSAGNVDAATADMESCNTAMNKGNVKMAAATAAVEKYNNSQGG